ncbi:hypothetical protein H2199_006540 [Coniosporium tulheliwenetii]|uniref:Uncharacterized protein n=1 Tax=Coniosporium tulheliwenetii TaxID=3383036 RepID=A0ACC2YW28_9PEZI|nr:hypothetical protein H2199_006540 [Cladosporium sp. JES 115]
MADATAKERGEAKRGGKISKIWIWSIIAESESSPSSQSSSQSLETIESMRAQYNLPGYAVGQSRNGTFLSLVTGVRKEGAAPLITPNDTFHIGSLTKAMTATLLASFIREGLFSWDTTIADALPELSSVMDPGHRDTTLAMLTSQFSGINDTWSSNLTFLEEMYNPALAPSDGRLEVARRVLSQPPASTPNTTWTYANSNYVLVGLILELRTNATWEEQMQSRLFAPLNMTGCGFGPNPEASNTSIDNPWPHIPDPNTGRPVPFEGSYAKFLRLHIDGIHQNASGASLPWYNLTTSDFQFLHTRWNPAANSETGSRYTPGGFWTRGTMILEHNGSNNLNAGHVYILIGDSAEYSTFGFTFTNVGGDRSLLAVLTGVDQMLRGDLDLFKQ